MDVDLRRFNSRLSWRFNLFAGVLLGAVMSPQALLAQDRPVPRRPAPAEQQPQNDEAQDLQAQDAQPPRPNRRQPADLPRTNQPARQPVPADPVTEMMKQIDPAIIARLAGADVTVEVVGGQIILHGPEEAVKTLELLIRGIDVGRESEQPIVQIVEVFERDANEIARSLEQSLKQVLTRPNQTPEQQVKITPVAWNILLVSAMPGDLDFVVDTIEKVDSIPDPLGGKIELMRFQINHRKAADVARELERITTQLRQAQGATKEKSKIQFIPNNANNTITVTAREAERENIQLLIDQIDVKPVPGFGELKLTVFPLLHSDAAELAKVIQDLLKSPPPSGAASSGAGARESVEEALYRLIISKASPDGTITDLPAIDLQKPLKIISDKGTNSLIVATPEENVAPMAELIRLLDGVPLGEGIAVRIFPLQFAAADTLADALNKMFDEGKKLPEDPGGSAKDAVPAEPAGKALVYNISIVADPRTNTLVVSGRPEQLSLVEQVVTQLDRPATALKFPLRLIALEFSDATALGQTITDLFDQRFEAAQAAGSDKTALERERLFLSVDLRSNSLIISASEENFNEVQAIVKQLDTKPAKLFDQIRIIPLQRLSATDMKTKVEDLWKRKADLRRQAELIEDIPVVAVDPRSNSLLIASSIEDFEEIQRLVRILESQPLIEDTQLFKLEFADATGLAAMLDELFQGIASQSENVKAPTILPDPRSNALVVAGSRDMLERVAEVVRRLDVQAGPLTSIFRVYPLRHGSAVQLAARIQELFDAQKSGETERTPVVVMAEETSNSLVVSASRDIHAEVAGLIELLDKPSSIARHFRIYPLKLARAANIAEKLEALFKSQAEGGAGRADVMAVQADERTNSLIVWASPSQMSNIGEIIDRLDTAEPTRDLMVRVIQLRQALAEDFAELLRKTLIGEGDAEGEEAVIVSFLEKTPDGHEIVRKLLRQDIKIEADPRTNSLMVMAPSESMAMLESMIHDFDKIRPITSEIRLFPLINSDAKTMVDQLKELFESKDAGAEGEAKSELVFGAGLTEAQQEQLASVGQQLRFAADARTNTLIAAGAPVYLTMVEDLVRFLDSQQAEDRVSTVYNAKFRPATDLAEAVKGFIDQELDVLGEGEDEESRVRRQERQVSVESVGDEEKGSSSLLVGTSARSYQRTMDLIQSLDRAEPQVMISVLIAEVSLTDEVDLGVEIAGQELDFSRNAVVGPNGVIEGSDFDFVGGNNLGAAGNGLGFNFTITGEDFSFLIRAMQTDSRLEVLSRPVLMVRNGEEGKITIADEVPIVSSSQITDSGQINVTPGREEVGIILTATPHISPDGYVTIELVQEISTIGANVQLSDDLSQPIFQKREVQTNITVRDGETAIVGGLIQSQDSQSETKVPLLGDLPGVGALFRTTGTDNRKTELLVVLTVDVLRTDEDVRQMSVEQRDKFILPDSIRQSPLMEGLRIKPEECGLGPRDQALAKPAPNPTPPAIAPDDRRGLPQEFGPKPKVYGPPINRPGAGSTTSTGVYGPRIARSSPASGASGQ